MIRISRAPEPSTLTARRKKALADLRTIVASARAPKSREITGYGDDETRDTLWKMQFYKCCYCESDVENTREDVEHFRPKAEADRSPGCGSTHGYWWLAHTWENLYYSCSQCNQPPNKGIKFPLDVGCTALAPEDDPPGGEQPLLVDPGVEDGIAYIEFVPVKRRSGLTWLPVPRNNSAKGEWTIRVCALDRDGLIVKYARHVEDMVVPVVDSAKEALQRGDAVALAEAVTRGRHRLLSPFQRFVGLSFDALRHFVPQAQLAPHSLSWDLVV